MATTDWKTIYGANTPGRRPYLNWRVTDQDITLNRSLIQVTAGSQPVAGNSTWGAFSGSVSASSATEGAKSLSAQVPSGASAAIGTHSFWVNHAADGKRTTTLKLTGGIAGTTGWPTGYSMSGSAALPTIPRATALGMNKSEVTLGEQIVFSMPRASSGFTHDLTYKIGSNAGVAFVTGAGTSYTWTPPLALAQRITNAEFVTATIYCVTKSGSTVIGQTQKTITLRVPADMVPTLGGISLSDAKIISGSSTPLSLIGAYVQGVSELKITPTAPTGVEGSTISGYRVTVGSAETDVDATGPLLVSLTQASGTVAVSVQARDSRGRLSAARTATITVLAYTPPQITAASADRATSAGVLTQLGTYIRSVTSGTVASLKVGSTEKNTLTRKIAWRKKGTSTWTETTIANGVSPAAWTASGVTVGAGAISVADVWEVRLTAADKLTTATTIVEIGISLTALSISKEGIGAGKIWQHGALDVGGDTYVAGDLYVAGNIIETDPNQVVIDGVAYAARGRIIRSVAVTTSAAAGLYVGNTALTMPFTPPPGWEYHITMHNRTSNAGVIGWVGYVTNSTTASITVRVVNYISATLDCAFFWELWPIT